MTESMILNHSEQGDELRSKSGVLFGLIGFAVGLGNVYRYACGWFVLWYYDHENHSENVKIADAYRYDALIQLKQKAATKLNYL